MLTISYQDNDGLPFREDAGNSGLAESRPCQRRLPTHLPATSLGGASLSLYCAYQAGTFKQSAGHVSPSEKPGSTLGTMLCVP